jgi:exodeoxyribonuclease-5
MLSLNDFSYMDIQRFNQQLKKDFGFELTDQQDKCLDLVCQFLFNQKSDVVFLLKGYAGTGKTTTISTLVKNLPKISMKSILAAPTGRAAKVMGNYSQKQAQTIHRKIYYPQKNSKGNVDFVLQENKHKNTVFIVDEASMIPGLPEGVELFKKGSLLEDLLQYVYAGENCKLILVGDTAQLPPVKSTLSPALDLATLQDQFQMSVSEIQLEQVVRQAQESDVLYNATLIRNAINQEKAESFAFELHKKNDLTRLIDGYEILDAIQDAYDHDGHENTAFIVRSNKRANLYNQQIRSRILQRESELEPGDFLMVVKNNYFWVKPHSDAGFIANGDIIEVLEIYEFKELYGFRFARAKIKMVDYPAMKPFETMLMLDTIMSNSPSLSYEDNNKLYKEVMKDYADMKSNYKKFLSVKKNPYFNALQVKFSYAITCHKSQGGQWNRVFVEQPYLPEGVSVDYLRWLYTAITRTKEKLYLIGFKDDFFKTDSVVE